MPQLRKDPISNRWVIVNIEEPQRDFAPTVHERSSKTCPFCPGNEAMTPPEILAAGRKSGGKDGPGWQVRVLPNKFPALRIEETPNKSANGVYDKIGGYGAHEVIIETPDHDKDLSALPIEHVETVLRVYRDRCQDLRRDPRLKYILIFKNYGAAAGASLEHPHSQLIALPIVPSRVQSEVKGGQRHHDRSDRCLFCDMLDQEETEKERIVFSGGGFLALQPFASRFPFETWILPRAHEASFDSIAEDRLRGLATVLSETLTRLKSRLGDPPFNLMIHTLPLTGRDSDTFHWHIEIIPHLTQVAGFELGTGFYVNPTPPELAAAMLRGEA